MKQRRNERDREQAAAMQGKLLQCDAASVEWLEAAADSDAPKRFSMTAYTGGQMNLAAFFRPAVFDLAGIKAESDELPSFLGHDETQIVGHGTSEITAQRIKVSGVVSGGGKAAEEVLAASRKGFPWKASVGVMPSRVEFVEPGVKVKANGRTFTGPINIVRAGSLVEISFVPRAADRKTTVTVAAKQQGAKAMDPKFQDWLEAKEYNPDELTAEQLKPLQAAFDAEQKPPEKPTEKEPGKPLEAAGEPTENQAVLQAAADAKAQLDAYPEEQAAETERVAAVRAACKGDHPKLEAAAIREHWSTEKLDLELLRAERPKAPAGHTSGPPELNSQVMEAAACRTLNLGGLEDQFDEKVLEASDKHFGRELGLQEMLLTAAQANGYDGQRFRTGELGNILRAGFSDLSLPGILSNVANKFILMSFDAVENTWRDIATIGTTKDFKTTTRYRLTGNMEYEELGAGGEIKHGQVGEENFTISVETYAKMYVITREDIINDDLSALSAIPKRLGRGAALMINKIFWTAFLNNAAFFTNARGNLITNILDVAGLTAAELAFYDQTDPDGDPLGINAVTLLVPNALFVTGTRLMNSTELRREDGTSGTDYGTTNPHAGKFKVRKSSYLSNANITGFSTAAWYLLGDPADLPVIELAFLNGKQAPTIESADADFNVLGIQHRGYHDFGASLQEYRAGVKADGTEND